MGKYNPEREHHSLPGLIRVIGGFNFSTPAFFNGWLYFGAVGDVLRAFSFTNARMNGGAVSRSANTFAFPGASPSISANGTAYGIVWAAENGTPQFCMPMTRGSIARALQHEPGA